MAAFQNEEEFKLPLRQWLTKKIDQQQFDGLQWVDENKQLFKIPWTQKGHPNWEKHYEIFIAWAKHRGNYDHNNPPDDKKLKGNFRCALNKSDDFEEMKRESRTNQQTGNFKLFKLLTSNEVKAKRENRKRPHPRSSETSNGHNSLDMPDQKKVLNTPQLSSASLLPPQGFSTIQTHDFSEAHLVESCLDIASPSDLNFPSIASPQMNSLQVRPPPPVEDILYKESRVSIQPTGPQQNYDHLDKILVSPGPVTSDVIVDSEPHPSLLPELSQLHFKSFHDFLRRFNISASDLSHFYINVRYGKVEVLKEVVDLSAGIRLMYGNPQRQRAILNAFDKNEGEFDHTTFPLPEYFGDNQYIDKILKSADLGILLHFDSKQTVRGTRLCQSQVFYFDNDGRSTKMNRNERIELFSYLKCVKKMLSRSEKPAEQPASEITLVVGTKPATFRSSTLVSVVLEPVVAKQLKEHFDVSDSSSLLAISQQTSMDQLIRLLDDMDMDKAFG